jgi:hypothetical protein
MPRPRLVSNDGFFLPGYGDLQSQASVIPGHSHIGKVFEVVHVGEAGDARLLRKIQQVFTAAR